jgi:hypothetical protein
LNTILISYKLKEFALIIWIDILLLFKELTNEKIIITYNELLSEENFINKSIITDKEAARNEAFSF